ncbi:unnamed protein product [Phytophthora fragariaefolia]|uniref:Unnamed protein product n=1 Tax=Phytophthora fragariaefolia TaxID=1490495 RepID=A0A9W6WL34_9STRA|nr:unnamed protein product [Phytophthora fragariaefolia]
MKKTWESIDSIYLRKMNSKIHQKVQPKIIAKWNKDNKGPLILFQMTVSKTHPGIPRRQRIVMVSAAGTDSVRNIKGIGLRTSRLLSDHEINTIDDLANEIKLQANAKAANSKLQ